MTARRHLLVVAAQRPAMPRLDQLDRAARALHDVLAHDEIGACAPGLADGRALLEGEFTAEHVREIVAVAVTHAAREKATLVVALLGELTGVDVPKLLNRAASRHGVRGVLAIVDTWSPDVLSPARQPRLGLMMTSSDYQNAFRLTFGLSRLLENGILEARRNLDIPAMVTEVRAVEGADVVDIAHQDDSEAFWLARNRGYSLGYQLGRAPSVVGRPGRAELAVALKDRFDGVDYTPERLYELWQKLGREPRTPAVLRATHVLDTLLVAARTSSLLHRVLTGALSTSRLRRAAPVAVADGEDVADVVERVALEHPAVEGSCRAQLARFVVKLAAFDNRLDDPQLLEWAQAVSAVKAFKEAEKAELERREPRRLWLIVSLHASTTGLWPEELETWLLRDGVLETHDRLSCEPTKAGVELVLTDVITKAGKHASELRTPLKRVDVAAPTELLVHWKPDNATLRWSDRLSPPRGHKWMLVTARRCLDNINFFAGGAPVDWLDEQDTRDLAGLVRKLASGDYERAIALKRPDPDPRLLWTLLTHIPVVLWPESVAADRRLRRALDEGWDSVPDGLRAVWDDEEWLDFCQRYQRGTRS
ncbi:hypothetical protein SAMN05421504_107370 [Amycolatopsis xylanica]|uniref:vWA-MoxR associated protein middle region 2 domain-containing protein n=1 Tax=Amycolatopsis xylanica TaxID=589385 RepID=A0A1H3NMK8_9PSEU|nr:hypothetical protein [Amycolatopsis xylanica]SDY89993.1 hypothetical protein SAMN05421504_107370 [Amycolatopsis xylanica]